MYTLRMCNQKTKRHKIHLPVIEQGEVTRLPSLRLSGQVLEEGERILKQLHQECLKLSRDAVPHQQLVHAVHRERAEIAGIVSTVPSTVAAKISKMEDCV